MPDAPTTHPSLPLRLRNPGDRDAWGEFVNLYAPFVYGYARKRGLQDADAADLTQTVLRAVAGAAGRFDYSPARGSFRGWLFTIVRNKLRSFRPARDGFCRGSGDSATLALLEAAEALRSEAARLEQPSPRWRRVLGGSRRSCWSRWAWARRPARRSPSRPRSPRCACRRRTARSWSRSTTPA